MYIVADILVLAFIALLVYQGIKKGFMNFWFDFVMTFVWLALGIGSAVGISMFVLDKTGLLQDLQFGLVDFAQQFAGLISLLNIGISTADLAKYIAIGVASLILIIPCNIFWFWVGKQFKRFVSWVRKKAPFFKYLGSVLGGLVSLAISGGLVFVAILVFALFDGTNNFMTYSNDVLRSGYVTGLIYNLITTLGII